MNKQITDLNSRLSDANGYIDSIEAELQKEWNKVFEQLPQLTDTVSMVENSRDYCWDMHGEIVSWLRFYPKEFLDCKEYFKVYMRENHCIEVDFQNDALMYSQGPCIVINNDGDVLDQDGDKWFIKKNDYLDEETGKFDISKRNELIEAYMEKTGCFPGVFESDYYGNLRTVKTN